MLGSSRRSIDDLLGPAGDEPRTAAVTRGRHGWLREWPLLIGLSCSLALIGGAMLIDSPDAPPVTVAKATAAAGGDYSAGDVVDVGEDEVAADTGAPAGAAATPAKRNAKKAKKATAATDAPSTTASSPSDTSASAPSGSSGGSRGKTGSGTRRAPSGGATTPGRIVNVTGTSASIRNGPLAYSLAAPSHSPRVGTPWRLTVSATNNGKPLTGKVKVDILHNGAIVGHAANGKLSGGKFGHDFDWPAESVGHPLTVKATVIGGGFQQSFLFDVKVKAAG